MRASKVATSTARGLFRLCIVDGKLDEDRVRLVAKRVTTRKPRDYAGILNAFTRLVRLEIESKQVTVESATDLADDDRQRVEASLNQKYGDGLNYSYLVNADLLGGLKVRVGDDVFDGSVQGRLERLANSF